MLRIIRSGSDGPGVRAGAPHLAGRAVRRDAAARFAGARHAFSGTPKDGPNPAGRSGDGGTDTVPDQQQQQQGTQDAPTPLQSTNPGDDGARACVLSEDIPEWRSGPINRGGQAGEQIRVRITWRHDTPPPPGVGASYCACRCGEYRQYVKGHLIINGQPETMHLWAGAVLEDNVYHEDGLDRDPSARYGHRDEPLKMNEDFLPNRASGCAYVGHDFPRVMIGDQIDMLQHFKGQSYDRCADVFGPIHEWEVKFVGKLNYNP